MTNNYTEHDAIDPRVIDMVNEIKKNKNKRIDKSIATTEELEKIARSV